MNPKRTIPGLIIGLAGVVLFTIALLHIMKIGTCASGGPYVSARPCPSGTGGWIGLLIGGILASIVGMLLCGGVFGAGLVVWSALFAGSGTAMLVQSLTANDLSAGAKSAGYIVGTVFILMGGVPLVWLISRGLSGAREKRFKAHSRECEATVSRVEELQRYGFNQAKIRITYAIQPLDDASFEVSRETNVLVSAMPHVGQRVKARYNASDHERFEIVTQSVADSVAALQSIARGRVAAAPAAASLGAVANVPAAVAHDPIDRLEELVKLRDQGALTPAEFEAQKARILAQS